MATKSRGFTGLVYPDSKKLPDNWKEKLEESLMSFLISPLHEPDPITDLEKHSIEFKKPHYHILYHAGNTVPPKSVRETFEKDFPWMVLPPNDNYFMVGSIRNLSRYFLHLDQPNKQQFGTKPQELLTNINSFPLDLEKELSKKDKRKLKEAVMQIIRENNIIEYSELCYFLMDNGDWQLFDYATDHTILFNHIVTSRRHSLKNQKI